MNEPPISENVRQILRDAGNDFDSGTEMALNDVRAGGVRRFGTLERLFLVGLSLQDQEQLSELARLVFEEEDSPDVRELANQVKSRESASPLAIVIADIVLNSFMGNKKQSMLGAMFGAYAALRSGSIERACIGAIAGAITMNVSIFMPIDTIQLGEGFS